MVENGGHGGSIAAPIARKVTDYWLLGKLPTVYAPVVPDAAVDTEAENEEDVSEDAPATPGLPTVTTPIVEGPR